MPNFVLLTGAGFSRNWGGWLVDEVLEYLLGCPELGPDVRNLLLAKKLSPPANFEDALADIQSEHLRTPNRDTERRLQSFQAALVGMFRLMDEGFSKRDFEWQNSVAYLVRTFLAQFDAIFTTNQDLLLERHYLRRIVAGKHDGFQIPMMKRTDPTNLDATGRWEPDAAQQTIQASLQPYFKLHGSSNWVDANGSILIMGGAKANAINTHPVLSFYQEQFASYLNKKDTRLMVIGYSFRDYHINTKITEAAKTAPPEEKQFSLYLVDPNGLDVLDAGGGLKNVGGIIHPTAPMPELAPYVIGASRRPLSSIFGTDFVEHSKLMRFFS